MTRPTPKPTTPKHALFVTELTPTLVQQVTDRVYRQMLRDTKREQQRNMKVR